MSNLCWKVEIQNIDRLVQADSTMAIKIHQRLLLPHQHPPLVSSSINDTIRILSLKLIHSLATITSKEAISFLQSLVVLVFRAQPSTKDNHLPSATRQTRHRSEHRTIITRTIDSRPYHTTIKPVPMGLEVETIKQLWEAQSFHKTILWQPETT